MIQKDYTTFTLGESTFEVDTGNIMIGQIGISLKLLRMVIIHPSKEVI